MNQRLATEGDWLALVALRPPMLFGALRPRMLLRALRPGMILASLASYLRVFFIPAKRALRPRMLLRALRPGVIFASLASTDAPQCNASYRRWHHFLAKPAGPCSTQRSALSGSKDRATRFETSYSPGVLTRRTENGQPRADFCLPIPQ